jgi:micrococcal nuclease
VEDAQPQQLPPSLAPIHTWVFTARATKFVDGDTIDVQLDQGMHTWRIERLRLLNINTPERKGATFANGNHALQFTMNWVANHREQHSDMGAKVIEWPLLVQTEKADAFGRYLAYVWCRQCGACLNDDLVSHGFAVVDIR